MDHFDVIVVGAGAAGLMCALEAGHRGRQVLVLEKANKPGKKILMSGGGRCNFTNEYVTPEAYISNNPHFCKSALSRYTPADFIKLVKKHHIAYHEKNLGQLFCDHKSQDVLHMLLKECASAMVNIYLNSEIIEITKTHDQQFKVQTNHGNFSCCSLVIASGGLSIPTMGASPFGYKIAAQFGINVHPTRPGLVPLTLQPEDKEKFATLAGVSIDCIVNHEQISFREHMLFTHRGLSGPAILQISSYWQPGENIYINVLPDKDVSHMLQSAKKNQPQKQFNTVLSEYLPKRFIDVFFDVKIAEKQMAHLSNVELAEIVAILTGWSIKPNGTEGYRTAEVTLGGVDCDELSSKTMAAIKVPGLFFIGEVVDVTGWLGGYNFQWAWASGWAAGQVV